MIGRPAVTVVIPSHRPGFLSEAMSSVYAQTFKDFQLLISYSEKWWPEKINATVAAAAGEYIVVLCDDDKLHPDFLAATMARAREGFDLVYTDAETFNAHRTIARTAFGPFVRDNFVKGPPCWITTLIRKSLWDELGGFDHEQLYFDWDLWWRAYKHDAAASYVPEVLWFHRQHEAQGTNDINRPDALARFYRKHPELLSHSA